MDLRLDCLPDAQRRLWPKLRDVPAHFTLYGGTALALHLGHRESVDFDFFSPQSIDPIALKGTTVWMADAKIIRQAPNTLTLSVDEGAPVQVSFFGGLALGIAEPPVTAETGLAIASVRDVLATKLNTVQARAEAKDYIVIAAGLRAGWTLEQGFRDAQIVWGDTFNAVSAAKALSYFGDVRGARVPPDVQDTLTQAVACIDIDQLGPDRRIDP